MKIRTLFTIIVAISITTQLNAQYSSLIIGDGVRLRKSQSTKGDIVTKLDGQNKVTIQVIDPTWDDLGKGEMCEKYQWAKIKSGDNIGWVYGKYLYNPTTEAYENRDMNTEFWYENRTCNLVVMRNMSYPAMDGDGLTTCSEKYSCFVYDQDKDQYYRIMDAHSEHPESFMTLYMDYGLVEKVKHIQMIDGKLNVMVDMQYQEDRAEGHYIIEKKNSSFMVSSFTKKSQ